MSVFCSAAKIVCQTPCDCGRILASIIAAVIGVVSLFTEFQLIGWLTILAIDVYVAFIILCTAVASSYKASENGVKRVLDKERDDAIAWLPSRPAALIILPLFVFALIFSFASIYYKIPIAKGLPSDSPMLTAVYFSAAKMLDFSPTMEIQSGYPQFVEMMQHISAFIMLIAAMPLLVGRLTSWSK